jgi:hypothetical protein
MLPRCKNPNAGTQKSERQNAKKGTAAWVKER